MSRTPLTRRPVRAVLALTVGAASLVGLGQASAAPPVTYAVTGVSPAYVEADTTSAFGVTLTGKGFTRDTVVSFSGCTDGGVTVPPTTVTATRLVVKPPRCDASSTAKDITISRGAGPTAQTSTLKGRLTFLKTPEVAVPTDAAVAAVAPSTGSWSGGTVASLDVVDDLPARAAVQVRFTTGGVTKAVAGKATGPKKISFKVPPGLPGVEPEVAVSVFGILSEPVTGHFEYLSTITTSPAVWVKGAAAAPAVKVDGAGFTKDAKVTICGVEAPLSTSRAPSPRTLVVTPPTWAAVAAAGDDVDAEKGGVCTVQVTVGTVVSVITAGSTFTYAAH